MTLRAVAGGSSGGMTVGTTAISGGVAYAVLREDGSQNLAASSGLLFGGAAAGTGLQIAAGTATTAVQALDLTQTWNAGGVTFTGIKLNVTNTASAAASMLIDLQRGGTSQFKVLYDGTTTATGTITGANLATTGATNANRFNANDSGVNRILLNNTVNFIDQTSAGVHAWSSTTDATGSKDTSLSRISAGALGVGTGAAGSTAGQIFATDFGKTATTLDRWTSTDRSVYISGVLEQYAAANRFSLPSGGVAGFSSTSSANGTVDTGLSRISAGVLGVGTGAAGNGQGALFFSERTAPSAPAANGVYIYAEDNGSGKTRLMALFNTGAAQQIAIEP